VHGSAEAGHERPLATVFGEVTVRRLAYRRRGEENLYPADGALNLPGEVYSHGLRRLAAEEPSRGSFDEAVAAIERGTGQHVPKRQVEELARRAAADFEAFYEGAKRAEAGPADILVISADGKGIVMRPEGLRPGTAKAAASKKIATRLSKGERPYRTRMAEVGAVYDLSPVPRRPEDIMGAQKGPAPVAKAKWLTASVADSAAEVIKAVFDEAARRDPAHERTWVALVDGARHQIDRIKAEAKAAKVEVTVVCRFCPCPRRAVSALRTYLSALLTWSSLRFKDLAIAGVCLLVGSTCRCGSVPGPSDSHLCSALSRLLLAGLVAAVGCVAAPALPGAGPGDTE
jgi:hypothetical protein